MKSANEMRGDLVMADEYAVQLTDLVSSAMAQLTEGGGLAKYPHDDNFEMKLQEINLTIWRMRWQLGSVAGEVQPDPEPAQERAKRAEAAK